VGTPLPISLKQDKMTQFLKITFSARTFRSPKLCFLASVDGSRLAFHFLISTLLVGQSEATCFRLSMHHIILIDSCIMHLSSSALHSGLRSLLQVAALCPWAESCLRSSYYADSLILLSTPKSVASDLGLKYSAVKVTLVRPQYL
jgi:hypothetical protein